MRGDFLPVAIDFRAQPVLGARDRIVPEDPARLVDVRVGAELVAFARRFGDDPGLAPQDLLDDVDAGARGRLDVGADVEDLAGAVVEVIEDGDEPLDDVTDI